MDSPPHSAYHSFLNVGCGADLAMIPSFNGHGVLPPGRYNASPQEVEHRFVDTFPNSATRRDIFRGWRSRREALTALIALECEWIDGSFVTSKSDAADIDVATFIRYEDLVALGVPQRQQVQDLTSGARPMLMYGCDSYLVVVLSEGHPQHGNYLAQRGYWDRWWGKHSAPSGKGYIEVR